ncbi:4'-phosphopantetheinyl transferase family protein [Paenibacillus odorifer]|uniref:4'-phosphopantetheinyl transferase family protein n=2 Tax=Paenibacillus TaxID=44249 RepID=UPI0015C36B1F|nr:4'-phosphopantetheinyl transferase superfamily protein [Paenibacillus odorifer]
MMQTRFDELEIDETFLYGRLQLGEIRSLPERRRSLFARCLLYYVLEKDWGIGDIALVNGRFGKPHLNGGHGVQFNISHSGDWVCCAVSPDVVGVDIQVVHELDLEISQRFFMEEEHAFILSGEDPVSRTSKFFDIWSCKEAYIKMLGYGLNKPLNSFEIRPSMEDGYCVHDELAVEDCRLYLQKYEEVYKLAVCYNTPELVMTVEDHSVVLAFISGKYGGKQTTVL